VEVCEEQSLNNCYYETFDDFKRGIDACLNDIDKKTKGTSQNTDEPEIPILQK